MSERMDPFSDPQAVARYAEGAPRNVPGYYTMQRMTTLLLAERVQKMPGCWFSAPPAGWS